MSISPRKVSPPKPCSSNNSCHMPQKRSGWRSSQRESKAKRSICRKNIFKDNNSAMKRKVRARRIATDVGNVLRHEANSGTLPGKKDTAWRIIRYCFTDTLYCLSKKYKRTPKLRPKEIKTIQRTQRRRRLLKKHAWTWHWRWWSKSYDVLRAMMEDAVVM